MMFHRVRRDGSIQIIYSNFKQGGEECPVLVYAQGSGCDSLIKKNMDESIRAKGISQPLKQISDKYWIFAFEKRGVNTSRGLIQVTEQTRKILGDQKGELGDFLITLSENEFYDPNLNLAAGIRWLFHKKYLASHRLKREVTWMEAIAEYKGILPQLGKVKKSDEIMNIING